MTNVMKQLSGIVRHLKVFQTLFAAVLLPGGFPAMVNHAFADDPYIVIHGTIKQTLAPDLVPLSSKSRVSAFVVQIDPRGLWDLVTESHDEHFIKWYSYDGTNLLSVFRNSAHPDFFMAAKEPGEWAPPPDLSFPGLPWLLYCRTDLLLSESPQPIPPIWLSRPEERVEGPFWPVVRSVAGGGDHSEMEWTFMIRERPSDLRENEVLGKIRLASPAYIEGKMIPNEAKFTRFRSGSPQPSVLYDVTLRVTKVRVTNEPLNRFTKNLQREFVFTDVVAAVSEGKAAASKRFTTNWFYTADFSRTIGPVIIPGLKEELRQPARSRATLVLALLLIALVLPLAWALMAYKRKKVQVDRKP
jgi:hypothetical protein